jgi:hypothetical protein
LSNLWVRSHSVFLHVFPLGYFCIIFRTGQSDKKKHLILWFDFLCKSRVIWIKHFVYRNIRNPKKKYLSCRTTQLPENNLYNYTTWVQILANDMHYAEFQQAKKTCITP